MSGNSVTLSGFHCTGNGLHSAGFVTAQVAAKHLFHVTLQAIEKLQRFVGWILAGVNRRAGVVEDPAGERAHPVYSADPLDGIEKRTVTGFVDFLRQQVEDLLFVLEHVGPASAAPAGYAAGMAADALAAEGMGKHPPAEVVCQPVEKGNAGPWLRREPLQVKNPPLELFPFHPQPFMVAICEYCHSLSVAFRFVSYPSVSSEKPRRYYSRRGACRPAWPVWQRWLRGRS